MIVEQYYLSDPHNLEKASEILGISQCEIEEIVGGRFTKVSRWAGQVKGKLEITDTGMLYLRTSFGSKTLWKAKMIGQEETFYG